MNDILVSLIGTAKHDDQTGLDRELCALMSRFCSGARRVQADGRPSVEVRLARKAKSGVAERRVVRGSVECASSSLSASERSGQVGQSGRSRSVGGKRELPHRAWRGGGST